MWSLGNLETCFKEYAMCGSQKWSRVHEDSSGIWGARLPKDARACIKHRGQEASKKAAEVNKQQGSAQTLNTLWKHQVLWFKTPV